MSAGEGPAGLAALAGWESEFERALSAVRERAEWEALRVQWMGRKQGIVRTLLEDIKKVEPADRRAYGEAVNRLKATVEQRLGELDADLAAREREAARAASAVDVTLPGRPPRLGSLHPVTLVIRDMEEIFAELGWSVAEGPEVETDYHNFEALNFPKNHPARDTQDTFFLEDGLLLRTHTSPVQIRTMLARRPPIRVLCPGRVFRNDNDLRHSPMFHQVEGLAVAEGITVGHLKGTLLYFLRRLFAPNVEIRLRPSYFPFTEPSAEVDVTCQTCGGAAARSAPAPAGWRSSAAAWSIRGCSPGCGIDPDLYSGFAFGMGVDRVAMNRYGGIPNIRLLFENDERLLRQVKG